MVKIVAADIENDASRQTGLPKTHNSFARECSIRHANLAKQIKYQHSLNFLIWTRRYGPLRGLSSSSCEGHHPSAKALFSCKKNAFSDVFAHFMPF